MALSPAAEARERYRVLVCPHVRHSANTGTVVGAVGGGLLGNAIGGDTGSTLVGAGVGAVAGHQIAKGAAKKKHCHYEYRYRPSRR
jgi:outer membrane lipoprotein SlyB